MPATRPWQEDGRFGLALILVLLAVNLGLMLWLPPMTALHSTVNAASVPVVIGTAEPLHAPVTLYRQSAEARQPVHILGLPEPTLRQETPASAP